MFRHLFWEKTENVFFVGKIGRHSWLSPKVEIVEVVINTVIKIPIREKRVKSVDELFLHRSGNWKTLNFKRYSGREFPFGPRLKIETNKTCFFDEIIDEKGYLISISINSLHLV